MRKTAFLLFLISTHTYSMEKIIHNLKEDLGVLADLISPELGNLIHGEQPAIAHNPHKYDAACVRIGNDLSQGEQEFLEKRKSIVHTCLENIFNKKIEKTNTPTIAAVFSGGGYRALLCTTAFLRAAQKIKLLDAITWNVGLSGSTWAIAPWISTGLSLKEFKKYITTCLAKPFHDVTREEGILIANMLTVERIYNRKETLVNIYGALIANRLLEKMGNERHITYLSEQAKLLNNATIPYPIYTAIDGRESAENNPAWYEFTPHETGSCADNIRIPSWAYGRTFEKGETTDNATEENLGKQMGTWGSAFAASINNIWQELKEDAVEDGYISQQTEEIIGEDINETIGKIRLLPFWSKTPNYRYKIDTNENYEKKQLKLVDAGLAINLPYPPVSGTNRKPNIILFIDASAGDIGDELKKVELFARKNNHPFPYIDYTNIDKKTLSVFKDKLNTLAPVVIYMPRISDHQLWEENKLKPEFKNFDLSDFDFDKQTSEGFCVTQDFCYTPKESKQIMDQIEFNVLVNKDALYKEIEWVMNRK